MGGIAFTTIRSSSATQTAGVENAPVAFSSSDDLYEDVPGPSDWTEKTPLKIYNRRNGQWEEAVFGDVGNDIEFIVGDYVYATTEQGYFFLKPEIDINKLAETDRPFDPDNWRVPKADDVVFLFKSVDGSQQKGHWLFTYVKAGSEIVFQGKVWRLEYDIADDKMGVVDTGNVFAQVTQTHVNFHEDDVLALTVKFDSCGKTDLITGSEEHPFYVLDVEDYVPMVDLQPDMRLKTDNGSLVTVVDLKPLDELMGLYNLTVEHVHNYYIYTSEDDPGILVHNTGPCNIPSKASNVLTHVQNTGNAPTGYRGGRTFMNDGRGGGQVLPRQDAVGNPIIYKEYDINPYQRGVNRGAERIVIGSDGRAYYTSDHYSTFTLME